MDDRDRRELEALQSAHNALTRAVAGLSSYGTWVRDELLHAAKVRDVKAVEGLASKTNILAHTSQHLNELSRLINILADMTGRSSR